MMSENVDKRKENGLPSDNVQATLMSVDAKDSIRSADFYQQKTSENRAELCQIRILTGSIKMRILMMIIMFQK